MNIEKFTYKEYIKYKSIFEKLWKIIDENNSFELVKYLKAGEVHSHVFIPKNCN